MNKNNSDFTIPKEIKDFIDNLNLDLANIQILGSNIFILANLISIRSAKEDKQKIYEKKAGVPVTVKPAETAYKASTLSLLAIYIFAIVAERSLIEQRDEINSGISRDSITPYEKIFNSSLLNIIAGNMRLEAIEELLRVSESEETLI
ncbi:hypothetical protein [Clostridium fallax]|uniref:Uncharacterized protein n=1 Tax=Clostridium fallax TaxID=1533 RepID=A0A1M4XY30_9CLOT|nr:hypothetical protein [Clostridium fallax]SHE98345.1 hypothetical protein SAMN05443638_1229 [Clostridium fallax]SQB06476.1 Uncharacterised protein [Clostridium fallax]